MAGKPENKDFYQKPAVTAKRFALMTLIGLVGTATLFFSAFHDKNNDG
jgi:hypothetical protein